MDFKTSREKDTLVLGVCTITLELAIRFLDDYLSGDKYFKIDYPKHNLGRCRCQLKFFNSLMQQRSEMEKMINQLKNSSQ